jgi:hypothetical protein
MKKKAKKDNEVKPGVEDSKDVESPQDKKEPIENWADKPDSDIYEKCQKMYSKVQKAYKNKEEANESIREYWAIYNAQPDDNQVYQGNSKCYVPAVRDAVKARSKRALKQLFPQKYNHVDAVGTDGKKPYPQLALLEHYIRTTKLKSVCRSILTSGDVTGQWNIYVDWLRDIRNVSGMVRRNPAVETLEDEVSDPVEEEEVVEDQEIVQEGPTINDFATEDLAIIPPTCNDVEKAELVSVKLRLSKSEVERMVEDGIFILPEESEISEWVDANKGKEKTNPEKARTSDAGIKTEGTNSYALIYEVTARLEFEDGKKSLAYIYFAGENECLGIIKAPQWGQKRPVITAPVERVSGSAFGISPIEAVKWLQWNLNDFWNMGQDSAMYSLLPIVMTDPEKNPNYAMMVYGLAAVWPTSPESTKFASMPALWKDSIEMCQSIKAQIHESMDVNPGMMGQMPKGRKNAGAVGAQQQEQSVSIIDLAERFEEEILNPLMERFFEYDCQFREEDLTVLTMGEIGVEAAMTTIEPMQWENRYFFQWTGTEFVMNMQRMQQQIATMNVLRGIPPQQLNGRKLDITPILEILVDNVFGSELSNRILIDDRNKYSVPPEIEDEMMINGIPVDVHEADDDAQHLQAHQVAGQKSGDMTGLIRTHMQAHMQQMQKKRQMAQAAAQPPQGAPGVPGGAAPGVAGSPRPGAQPQMPRPGQNPPGAIGPDQMPGQPGRG